MDRSSHLNLGTRDAALDALKSETFDVLIVGGGITGLGCALDAASRGLSVALIDKGDFASGTSSKSSKMIHGGLRYLAQLRFGLVRQALHERGLLLRKIAPHLVRPLPFVYQLRRRWWDRIYVGAGIALYDKLGGSKHLPDGKHLSHREMVNRAPCLRQDAFVGGIEFWDAQEDDARYALFVARTAASYGAVLATYVQAERLVIEQGRISGVEARDLELKNGFPVRARHVVCAAGAWTSRVLPADVNLPFEVRPSRGVHFLLPQEALDMNSGLIAKTAKGLLFVIPFEGKWMVGDTDTSWEGDPDQVEPSVADIDTLLDRLNSLLCKPIDRAQISGVFVGLRPLVGDARGTSSRELSRSHAIANPLPALTVIAGGKYTTYRKMAEDLVDQVCKGLGSENSASVTKHVVLVGGAGYDDLVREKWVLSAELEVDVGFVETLMRRYGTCLYDLMSLIRKNPELRTLLPGSDVMRAEIVHACRYELAVHLDDVFVRRTQLVFNSRLPDERTLAEVAGLMQKELGWSDQRRDAEVGRFKCRQERLSACLEAFGS